MAQMIRKQIYIDADHERFLKERSSELGITEAEVVRLALAEAERQAVAEAEERAKHEARLEALDNLMAYIREHRMRDVSQSGPDTQWKFNRDELYDDMYEERFERPRRRREEASAQTVKSSTT
jgi:hypothetical protein